MAGTITCKKCGAEMRFEASPAEHKEGLIYIEGTCEDCGWHIFDFSSIEDFIQDE